MTELLDNTVPQRPTLTVQETAELLGISRWLVQQAVHRGDLPHVRVGRRILVPRSRLLAFLAGDTPAATHYPAKPVQDHRPAGSRAS